MPLSVSILVYCYGIKPDTRHPYYFSHKIKQCMKQFTGFFMIAFLLSGNQLLAQTCTCMTLQSIASGASYVQAGNDFNCHMYVKAYFKGNHFGDWIPATNYNFSAHSSSSIVSDPSFIEVTDPSQANAVFYPCDHSAVVRSSGCLISKANFGSDLYRHGLNNIGCGNTGIRFFKYVSASSGHAKGIDQSCLPPPPNCNISCTISGTYNNGIPLSTFNYVSTYFNTANVTCNQAHHFTWTKTSGSAVYYACSNSNCSGFYFYLNPGQSVTFNVKAYDACNNVITNRNYTFSRSSGYKQAPDNGINSDEISIFPNPASDWLNILFPDERDRYYLIKDIQGKELVKSRWISGPVLEKADISLLRPGVYILQVVEDQKGSIYSSKFVVK